ncbi:MAG: hypothetical protein OEZ06_30380 [Myxococcales bacterium]|nr:hypothetical protein [Myxococcales bacterium]
MRISNSFSEGEIQVMDFIVQTLLRGGTPTMATRHKEFASLCRKIMAMKNKVHERHREQAVPAESAVGTVDAPLSPQADAPVSPAADGDDLAAAV